MLKLQLLRIIAAILLGFSLLVNFAFGVGVSTALARGGLKGVTRWIDHITYEGTWRITGVSPGVIRVTMPVVRHLYLRFVLDWLLMIGLACAGLYLLKLCTPKIDAKYQRA